MLPSKQFTKETTEQEQTLSFSSIQNRGIQGWYVRAIQPSNEQSYLPVDVQQKMQLSCRCHCNAYQEVAASLN